jgi:hypothetical protein
MCDHCPDWLDCQDLLDLGLPEAEADDVLCLASETGHDGEPVVAADQLDDLLKMLDGAEEDDC